MNAIVLVTQSCPTLYESMDCSLTGSSVHGLIHVRILEWTPIPFSRVPTFPTQGLNPGLNADRFFYHLRSRNGGCKRAEEMFSGVMKMF